MANSQQFLRNTLPFDRTLLSGVIFSFLLAFDSNVVAQQQLTEQADAIKAPNAIAKIGTDLFGDTLNMYQGRVTFTQTDVSLRGNSMIPVQVGRRLTPGGSSMYSDNTGKAFSNWSLDMPYVYGVFSDRAGWTVWTAEGESQQARCSQFGAPAPVYSGESFEGAEFWQGNFMYIPGHGEQQLLRRDEAYLTAPNADPATYPVVTASKWAVSCLPTLANDPAGTRGQGFLAVSPDGVQYRFDQMVEVPVWSISKPYGSAAAAKSADPTAIFSGEEDTAHKEEKEVKEVKGKGDKAKGGPSVPHPDIALNATLARKEVRLLVTLITDRFGNWVRYNYDPTRPMNVTSITSSDGRKLTLSYTDTTAKAKIAAVTDGVRTWTYNYGASATTPSGLISVVLPDASSWNFGNLYSLDKTLQPGGSPSCGGVNFVTGAAVTGSMSHPSGATGTFTLTATAHGRSNVPMQCRITSNGGDYPGIPKNIATYSLTSKSISGPGMATMNWSYAFGPKNSSFSPCTGTCPTSKTVTVTEPSSVVTRYTFGNLYQISEGRIEKVEAGWDGTTALTTTTTRYRSLSAGPYPTSYGYGGEEMSDGEALSRLMPADQKVTTQQGVDFIWTADDFDANARVTKETSASTMGMSRTTSTTFADNQSLWVLDQPATVTEATTGKVMSANTYRADNAMLETTSKFGKLQETLGYNADGTLGSRTDDKNQKTSFTNYKAGIPQDTSYHDGTSSSAVVTTNGYITSMTNAAGFVTSFGYDAMGRLSSVTHPNESNLAWNVTGILAERVAGSEYGITGAHWRQTVSTGNARSITYYDGLLRGILTRTFDVASPTTTGTAVATTYDHRGNVTFASYPQRDISSIATPGSGATNTYDALGRPSTIVAASELGNLTTSYSYGSPFTTTVTNARNLSTTSSFHAFDQPTTSAVASIAAREGVSVNIARDVFGKPTAITRSGGGKSATRSYVYDSMERLCKTIEPETGATVQDYDLANNVSWRASGMVLPQSDTCDIAAVPTASKMSFGYDKLNRLESTTFGDGSPAITRSYTADGLPNTVTSNGAIWTNRYNKRRLLEGETLAYGGANYSITRQYDANGSLKQLVYPGSSVTLDYAPNALGQASKVGVYARDITYHPHGAIASFTYGNGIVHSMTPNARGLPKQTSDAGVLSDVYTYDENGNVLGIADLQQGVTSRTMAYDELDRLWKTDAPGLWGNAVYAYDGLGNLTATTISAGTTSRNTTHEFDPVRNRLTAVKSANAAYNFNYEYDKQGNIIKRGAQAYTFDQGNRMTSAAGRATYAYDGLGHRISIVGNDSLNRVQVYSQSGQLLYAGPNSAGSTKYIYLKNHVLAQVSAKGVSYSHTDGLGSPVARTSETGALACRTRYEPYGQVAAGSTQTIGFTGHVNDIETGLTYMQQRYYDPVAGRFLSIDPVTTDANTGGSFNR
ncbi:MAG: RHS repeat-associated core domain-containing protein, partial [Telluria sp.]